MLDDLKHILSGYCLTRGENTGQDNYICAYQQEFQVSDTKNKPLTGEPGKQMSWHQSRMKDAQKQVYRGKI